MFCNVKCTLLPLICLQFEVSISKIDLLTVNGIYIYSGNKKYSSLNIFITVFFDWCAEHTTRHI